MKRLLALACVTVAAIGVWGCMSNTLSAFGGPSAAALEAAAKAGLQSYAQTVVIYGDVTISNSQAKPIDAGNDNDLSYAAAAAAGAGISTVAGGSPWAGAGIGLGVQSVVDKLTGKPAAKAGPRRPVVLMVVPTE